MPEELPSEKHFHCKNGVILKNLEDLKEELQKNVNGINTENFEFHSKNNNDYANWIMHVFGMHDLAEKIRSSKTPREALEYLESKSEKKPVRETNSDESKKPLPEQDGLSEKSEELLGRVKKLKEKTSKESINESYEEKISRLKEEYEALQGKVSNERKNGKDMFISSLKLRAIKPKISYFEASKNDEDHDRITALLDETRKEIKEEASYEEPKLKQEIMEKTQLKEKEGEE